jgi:heptosyltransferase I
MRVLIVRLGAMGDVLHAMPAVAALRAAHPDAHIGWAIERRWTPLLLADEHPLSGPRSPQRPLIDHVHVVNTRAWRRAPFSDETWAEIRNVFREIRAEHYDFAIDFQGAIKSAIVGQFSGASTRIGFAQPREKPATMFYTMVVQPRARHIIDQNLSLVSPLCHPERARAEERRECESRDLLFPSDPAAEAEVDGKLTEITTTRFAILNPGAGWPAKEWPVDRYAEVARALRADDIVALVNYGPGEESLAQEVEQKSNGAAIPIFCTLAELIALIRRASLFIGGDTGPMHLATALGVPVVALFGPTDPARNGPYDFTHGSAGLQPAVPLASGRPAVESSIINRQSGNAVVLRHPSSRTDYSHRNESDPGLLAITADEIIAAARTLLKSVDPPFRPVLPETGEVRGDTR